MRGSPSAFLPAIIVALHLGLPLRAQFAPEELPQVGYHLSGLHYYTSPYFANALAMEDRNWRVARPKPGGQSWEVELFAPGADQVDSLGNPRYLGSNDLFLQAVPGQNSHESAVFSGRIVVTWQGEADIRVHNGAFLANGQNTAGQPQSSGAETGRLVNGVRVYQMPANPNGIDVRVYSINASNHPRDIRVWLAHPTTGQSLINQTFHPSLIARINDAPWGYIRFMDWGPTNASPQKDWADRRVPRHTFQAGILNRRDPSEGAPWFTENGVTYYFEGNRDTGVAFEHWVALANATNKHMWICVPHLATDDFVTKMAQVIRFGSDANGNPYTSAVSNPVHPPLNSNLKVFIEYSNEIWSNGLYFPQGNWAEERARALGITRAQFNARRFCQVWRIFQNVFGGSQRIVKVAAVFTGVEDYTSRFLNEIRAFGAGLTPYQEPDLIAPTTYFGNGIQDWAHRRAIQQAGAPDEWFYTTQSFDHDGRPETPPRPVSKPLNHSYWTSAAFNRHLEEAHREWIRRQLSGDSEQGGGFDATNEGGGFAPWMRQLASTVFPTPKPLVAYEGGPSLYTDYMDGDDARDDGVTNFILAMNRHPLMRDTYRIHLNLAKSKGLWSHMMFTDVSIWGKYGQWGHLESLIQNPDSSVKYTFIRDWIQEANTLRHIDRPRGFVPSFNRDPLLPQSLVNTWYSATIGAAGGDGARQVAVIGQSLVPGLNVSVSGDSITVSGAPAATGSSFIFARVRDADGDPAWRIFGLRTVRRSTDPAATVNFETNPVTGDNSVSEPVDISGYRFTSFGNDAGRGLAIQGTGAGWDEGWASRVLFGRMWGTHHRIARADGRPFDLFDLDVAAIDARSLKITAFASGGITFERVVNLTQQKQPMTRVSLDWVMLERVELQWYEHFNATGGFRRGAIDNLRFNTGVGVPPDPGGGGGSGGGGGGSPTIPAAPSGLTASAVSSSQINLNWTDNAGDETAYKVERATSSSGPWTEIAGSLAANTTSFQATGLAASTTYHFRVRASNAAGNSNYSNTASATTQASGGGGASNVALGKPATASTTESGRQPSMANDGDPNSRWTASGGTFPQWWEVDLGAPHDLTAADINFEGPSAWRFRIEGRASPSDAWTMLADRTSNSNSAQIFNETLANGAGKRYVRVTITGYTGGTWWASLREVSLFGAPASGGGGGGSGDGHPGAGQGAGSITRDVWLNISGTGIADIPVGAAPTSTGALTSFESPTNFADNYGQRVEGYLHPSTSGSYTFWIAGDDSVELWLSTTDQPGNLVRIAHHNGWTNPREWNKYPTQKSAPINLTAGQRYYIRALMKEGSGGDNLAVSWRRNATNPADGDVTFIIPGSALSPRPSGGGGGGGGGASNVALGKPATASTTESGRQPSMANDGDPNSRWTASGGTFPQWWEVDLGAPHDLTAADINFEGPSAWRFRIEGRASPSDAWTMLADRTSNSNSAQIFNETLANGAGKRYVRVTITGYTGGTWWASLREVSLFGAPASGGGGGGSGDGHPGAGQGAGSITRDVWLNISGTGIADIPVGAAPTSTGALTSFESPTNFADNYGQRVEGYLHPSTSGSYTFWIAGDDSVELWLSTTDQPGNLVRIAHHNGWTNPREWNKYPTQKSAPINLTAGQRYYIRALMKEGSGGDNLAVSWRRNATNPADGDATFIIPGSALSPRPSGGGGGGTAQAVSLETYDPPAAKSNHTHRLFDEGIASGGSCAVLEGNGAGAFVTYAMPNVQPGAYTIYVRHKRASNRAVFQLATADSLGGPYTDRGAPIDAYNAAMDYVETAVGTVNFSAAGAKFIRCTVTTKNAASSNFWIAVDRIRLQP